MQNDPKQLKRMMEQMGIKSEELPAERVVIEQENESIILKEPTVIKIEGKGQPLSFQITAKEIEKVSKISNEDIRLVRDQTKCSEEDARKMLAECKGDVAEAILKLKKE